ncbi:MAG: c-type cytochrome [Verrucomicrobiaceae bacterium]|nr:MAG: c-type cytochrome [Verrucomicrobiaceae bacterium]
MKFGILCASGLIITAISSSAETRILQNFEGDGFGDWKVEGEGFGLAPMTGMCDGLTSEITNFSGDSLVCSAHGGDKAQGKLESPEFKVTEDFLGFLVAGGPHKGQTAVQLLVDGQIVRESQGGGTVKLHPVVWDVKEFRGKSAVIRIVDSHSGGWGIIAADHFVLSDTDKPEFPPLTKGGRPPVPDLVSSEGVPGLTIPPGTKATIVAEYKTQGVTSPTALTFGEKGELYVSETHRFRHGVPDNRDHLYWYLDDISSRTTADRRKMHEKWKDKEEKSSLKFLTEKEDMVRLLSEPDAQGVYQKHGIFAGKFNDLLDGPAAGVFSYEGTVYLACIPKVYALRDKDGNGEAEVRDVIQDGIGVRVSFSGHDLNGFALGPDGRLYGTLGDRGMNIVTKEGVKYEMPDEGCVFRFDPDGSNFEVIHTGLRNPKEIAFDELGNAISVDNNCDQGDQARVIYVVDGADSGWNMGHQGLLVHHRQMGMDERPPARWMAEKMWNLPNPSQPAYILPPVAHITSGPSGLTYHPGTGFTEDEAGRFLVCDYRGGAANSGIWSFRVEAKGAGMKMTDSRKLNWGAATTDVEYSWDGEVTVTDFITGWASHEGGRVYSVTAEKPYRAEEAAQVAMLVKEGFEQRSSQELAKLLLHPDMRVRLRAELALTRKADGLQVFTRATAGNVQQLTRLHGVWGLGVIARRGAAVLPVPSGNTKPDSALREKARAALLPLLADKDVEIRTQAIKALGESGLKADGIPLGKLIADESARVRLHATLAAARLGAKDQVPAILTLLENADDAYLRHAGSHALSRLQDEKQLGSLKTHSSAKVRLAAVIALRKLKSDELAAFLNDQDRTVSDEAIRSINDQNLTAIRPLVGALLDQPAPKDRTTMQWRRILHSAFRTGDEANARRVLKAALDSATPEESRKEAFRLLSEWSKPHPVDQSTGRMSPLPERNPEIIRKVLGGSIVPLFETDAEFLEASLSLVLKEKLDIAAVPNSAIEALIRNEKVPGPARAEALEIYAARQPAGFDELLATLAAGKEDDLAIAALRRLVKTSPAAALDGLAKSVTSGSTRRKQEAWKLAADVTGPDAVTLFVNQLVELQKNNGVSHAALELLDAAAKRTEPEVKTALDAFKAAQTASTDPLTPYLPSLEGGDFKKGGQIFESHPAGQCMRCHSSGHGGGDAGPNLSGVGLRGDSRYMLQSMIDPGAKVAIGFGLASATLKGGKNVAGIVVEDTEDHVDFDSSGKVLRVLTADIQEITPPVSSMPPMGQMLSAIELRDLVAWLTWQKDKKKDEKKRPEPELVKP